MATTIQDDPQDLQVEDLKADKPAGLNEDIDGIQNENRVTEDILNVSRPLEEQQSPEPKAQSPQCRTDRFGTEIIPRSVRLKKQMKTSHKVTYIDQIHNQLNAIQPMEEAVKKTNKKLISIDSDKNRGIVNLFYVESYKKYNAMEIDEIANTNAICKPCAIF